MKQSGDYRSENALPRPLDCFYQIENRLRMVVDLINLSDHQLPQVFNGAEVRASGWPRNRFNVFVTEPLLGAI